MQIIVEFSLVEVEKVGYQVVPLSDYSLRRVSDGGSGTTMCALRSIKLNSRGD